MLMHSLELKERCHINKNSESDTFVGIQCVNGDITINFPLGYNLAQGGKDLRKDILLLFSTLAKHTRRKDSEILGQAVSFDEVDFPVQSYMYLIKDYIAKGYYQEQEVTYKTSKKGKINWNRTIKTQRPYVQDHEVFYLDFVTKKNTVNENELITQIHKYCVYESFEKIGWLFTESMPQKPDVKRNERLFKIVINKKLSNTFDDQKRMLFTHMLAVIDFMGDSDRDKNFCYGTYRFEYVWESMIDKVFGIAGKAAYFPKTTWKLKGQNAHDNAPLEPDTIMVHGRNVYVLDAKYYKYGIKPEPKFLPESSSIHKQITYGEYVASEPKFKIKHGSDMKVFNAFLMPFDALKWENPDGEAIVNIGEATGNWKDGSELYHHIQGILVDVKSLMQVTVRRDENMIMKMAEVIEAGLST